MTKADSYRAQLAALQDWDTFLLKESGLPGPRANLELVQVTADMGDAAQFKRWLAYDVSQAHANSPGEFLPLCGAVGMGRLVAQGARKYLNRCVPPPPIRAGVSVRAWPWDCSAGASAIWTHCWTPWRRGVIGIY